MSTFSELFVGIGIGILPCAVEVEEEDTGRFNKTGESAAENIPAAADNGKFKTRYFSCKRKKE